MKKIIFVCSLMLACSLTAKAQADYSKVDIFGGYSYVRFQFPNAGFHANGGSGQVTYNFNSVIGLTGDFGGYHVAQGQRNGSGTVFTYLFGPKLTYRGGNWSPFIQTLFGGSWLGAGIAGAGSTSFNAFSMALGGGTDYKVSDHVSVRLFDVDYLMTRFNAKVVGGTNHTQSNVRVSTGFVFHF
jgi:opacity protein-like surface antigen